MNRSARFTLGLILTTFTLPAMTGCGFTPGSVSGNAATQATKSQRPTLPNLDRTALQKTKSGISASSYYTVDRARRRANDSLWRYQDLREDWQQAHSDNEKDRIEMRMLSVLTGGASDIRKMTSGSWDYDDREIYGMADRMLDEYEWLRSQWQNEPNIHRKREIVNDMLVLLTRGLKDVSSYYRR